MNSMPPETPPAIDWSIELERHREWMLSVAKSRLGNPHAADDVIQEVSLAVIRQNSHPDDPKKIRSWLYQVVVRHCANLLRSELGEQRRVKEWASRSAGENTAGSDWVLVADRQRLLAEALANLSSDDRKIFLMKYREGRSYGDLAREFGVSERAVEYRVQRAKQQLRIELKVLGEDE